MEDLRGHPVLLTFWASWCGPCRAELPELVTLSRELKTSGLVLLAINVDSSAEAGLRFLRRGGIDVTAYRMSDQDQAMIGVRSLPTTILLDGDALPVQIFTGYSPGVVEAIRGLVQGMARPDSTSEQGSP
jgi:thiol-disulfide isomerase/thioredoxin